MKEGKNLLRVLLVRSFLFHTRGNSLALIALRYSYFRKLYNCFIRVLVFDGISLIDIANSAQEALFVTNVFKQFLVNVNSTVPNDASNLSYLPL